MLSFDGMKLLFVFAFAMAALAAEPEAVEFTDNVSGATFHIPFQSTIDYNPASFQKFTHGERTFAFSIFSNPNPKNKGYTHKDMYRFIEDRDFGELLKTQVINAPHQKAENYLFKKDNVYNMVTLVPTYRSATYLLETRLDTTSFQSIDIFKGGTYKHLVFSNRFAHSSTWWVIIVSIVVAILSYILGDSAHLSWFWTIVYVIMLMALSAIFFLYFTGGLEILTILLFGVVGLLASPSQDLRAFISGLLKE